MDRSTLISVIALLGVFALFVRQSELRKEVDKSQEPRTGLSIRPAATAPAAVEVAHHMARIQQHAEKLWWAGQAGNLELAKFYRHEIKEEMEVVADGNVVDDGVPVSDHIKVYGIRAIDALKEQLASERLKDFGNRYDALILACNSCHRISGHPELRMRIPSDNRFTGQDFTVQP